MYENKIYDKDESRYELIVDITRYLSFWKIFLISVLISIIIGFLFLRYATYKFRSEAKIEIVDKAQDSEMALPTSMTIFNRSMVNLDNEVGVLNSFSLHERTVNSLISNVKFFTSGRLKSSENHRTEWFKDYRINYKIDLKSIQEPFAIDLIISDNQINTEQIMSDGSVISYSFDSLNTFNTKNDLPFDIEIFDLGDELNVKKSIKFYPVAEIAVQKINNFKVSETGKESDQLSLSFSSTNREISIEYLNRILYEFDLDGIRDRQLEYKRTMDFVDSRSEFLVGELEKIEIRKRDFKEKNDLTNIENDAKLNISQKFSYNSDLFAAKSQMDLVSLLQSEITHNNYELLPVNVGINNLNINELIKEYNLLIAERDRYLISAGSKNPYVTAIQTKLNEFLKNIQLTVKNYKESLNKSIKNLELKENEFEAVYSNIPEKEKILRSIERELEVKEALFLLLLQKREEAAINFAVVKPSIKIIDGAMSSEYPISPRKDVVYLISILIGLVLPFSVLYLKFLLDTKIHTKEQLKKLANEIPIIGEIPYIKNNNELKEIIKSKSRNPIAESVRMVAANLNFVLFKDAAKQKNNLILVTSSIKGEGKTIVSVNTASVLASKFKKVLLIGADLRNPQIHKFLSLKKTTQGLSNYITGAKNSWKDMLIKDNEFDVLLSGLIPPNPTELLSSDRFKLFLDEVRSEYDYVVIDSAPCLLVSDTFEISKYVDTTLYVIRANYSEVKLMDFIHENIKIKKLSNLNLVFNGVGNSKSYGYNYSYSYGYKYGYKYGYNYGYGYGYNESKT